MKLTNRTRLALALLLFCLLPALAFAHKPYDRIVVFGDSLSDPGNAFALTGNALQPPYESLDALLIPNAPYAVGRYHFSNGATWIEQLARTLGLKRSAGPAFREGHHHRHAPANYAVGGARARDNGVGVNLPAQVDAYIAAEESDASDSLYAITIGGNDVRDAIAALAVDGTGAASASILEAAVTSLSDNIQALYASGAREFLIGNAPDLSLTPAIRTLDLFSPGTVMAAALISDQYNTGLDALLANLQAALPDLVIHKFDIYGILHELVSNPQQYRLNNVTDGCVMPGIQPYACDEPRHYLFWDGIHPTASAHGLFAKFARDTLLPCRQAHERDDIAER